MADGDLSGTGAEMRGATLSREQVAQIGYQVGFRGQSLIDLVAIIQRESGYRTDAFNGNRGTGDQSYGLMQINMIDSMGPSRRQAFGISSNEELYDPVTNLRAAYQMWQGQGGSFYDWGPYKGVSATRGGDVNAARAAVENAEAQGLLGQDWSQGGGGGGSGGSGRRGGGGGGSAPARRPISLPDDARLVKTEFGLFVLFNPAPGVNISYTVPWAERSVDTSGTQIEKMSSAGFDRLKAVNAGSAVELGNVTTTFGSFGRMWTSLMDQVFGRGNPARDDPGVLRAIAEFAARPDMDPMELENILKGTKYWRKKTDAERTWNDFSPAEQKKQRQDMLARMGETWQQYTGRNMRWKDPFMQEWVEDLASGKTSFALFTRRVQTLAKLNPESPFSRSIRDEQVAQRQHGVDIENTAEQVRTEAQKWGLKWKESWVQDWAERLVDKKASDEDLMGRLRDMASVRYPGKPPDMDTTTWAQNYLQSHGEIMEREADLFEPAVQKALKKGTDLADFEVELKMRPEWRSTKNGRNAMQSVGGELGRLMGFE